MAEPILKKVSVENIVWQGTKELMPEYFMNRQHSQVAWIIEYFNLIQHRKICI
jgi:hypothetical protein